ncbi:hypothetical protein [Nitratireductor sp. ZSWI3]|uniref:hypothetical protein n=1 Tax=Nitratireductor sp. ZSWI3 TaxID=2966359 RepID=UPI00214FA937|nr:hypothetical protein [Nitratireductor sp. ZSWI3]MCR4267872.1 hypothetical protein [Nitratireductor sp. ZSWI3]
MFQTFGFDHNHLYTLLSSFFRFAQDSKGYATIGSVGEGSRPGVVIITNDADADIDPLGAETGGLARRYQAASMLGSATLFTRFGTRMFGWSAETRSEPEEEGRIVETGAGPWLFADQGGSNGIANAGEVAFLLGTSDPQVVLRDVLHLPHYIVIEGDYFTYEDPQSGSIVVAQPFPTEETDYVELRLTLPSKIPSERIEAEVADSARRIGLGEVLVVIEFDDDDGTIQAIPIRQDGTKGQIRVLRMAI